MPTLNPGDPLPLAAHGVVLADKTGLDRYQANRQAGTYDDIPIGDVDRLENDRNSAGAEIVFAWYFGVEPRLLLKNWKDSIDCYLPDGRSVDVKSTERERGRLLCRCWEEGYAGPADLYVLITGKRPSYTYRGVYTRAGLFLPANLTWRYGRPCYAVGQRRLGSLTA